MRSDIYTEHEFELENRAVSAADAEAARMRPGWRLIGIAILIAEASYIIGTSLLFWRLTDGLVRRLGQ